jgi:hypothetical protein
MSRRSPTCFCLPTFAGCQFQSPPYCRICSSWALLVHRSNSTPLIAPTLPLLGWVILARSFRINNNAVYLIFNGDVFEYSRSIRSNKVPAWSERTWRPCAQATVSALPLAYSVQSYPCFQLKYSTSLLCSPEIHITDQETTVAIHANATRSYTAS